MTSPLQGICNGKFLTYIARLIGPHWKEFFTTLELNTDLFDHWQADHPEDSCEIIGLTEWMKIQLPEGLSSYRNIKEIKDWLLLVLESECERKDISDVIRKDSKLEMDQIIDMIAVKVTGKRWILLGALDIKWQSIEADLPTCTSIKMRTTTCLNSWFTEQHFNYWKYQMLLMAFRECQLVSGVENIIEKFKIKERKDVRQCFKAVGKEVKFYNCSESLASGNTVDSHIHRKALSVSNSEPPHHISLTVNLPFIQEIQHVACTATLSASRDIHVDISKGVTICQVSRRNDGDQNEQIVFQPSLDDKKLSRKSAEVIYSRIKRPIEETQVENDGCKKKLKTSDTDNNTGRIRHENGKEVLIASQKELKSVERNFERSVSMGLALGELEQFREKVAALERKINEMEEHIRQHLTTSSHSKRECQFYINCALCGKFIVDGKYIRRIKKAFSIICDKEIFYKIDRRKTKKSQTFDEIKKTEKVFGFSCGHNWGSILIYQECKFVSLSQDYMRIVNKETGNVQPFKKWSDVHMEFPLDDITDNELMEYRSNQ